MLRLWMALQTLAAREDEGATMVEYALIVVVIALVVVVGATFLGNSISSLFSSIAGSL